MKIESIETKLVKGSKIEPGDIVIVKMNSQDRESLSKEEIKSLYKNITSMLGVKDIGMYFFPKDIDLYSMKSILKQNDLSKVLNKKND
jgi:hypothetical protein